MAVTFPSEPARWYASKIDWWVVPVLCISPLAAIIVCAASLLSGSTPGLVVGLITAAVVGAIYAGLVFPMRYGMDDTHLIVRFGACRQRIPLANITEVRPTRNPLSSPALSLDRLRVGYGAGTFQAVMISPTDRDHFLDELAEKAQLKHLGDRWVRESQGSISSEPSGG